MSEMSEKPTKQPKTPIIHNSDHAEYEIENAGKPPEERSDWPLPSFDARDWARAFLKTYDTADDDFLCEETMIGWFANALMRGYDERSGRDHVCSTSHPEIRYTGETCPLCEEIRDRDNASDGHHTFKELYEHRHALFAALSKSQGGWKSKLHDDGTMFDGWFIAGCTTPTGPVTYHLPLEWWETFPAVALHKAPAWDGHTSADVVDRIKSLSRPSSDPGAGEVGK